jgi:hypothetical protein
MDPRSVQQFMEAFARGFEGVDFKQRLKTALVVGVEKVSKILEKDFENKAIAMERDFGKIGAGFGKALKGSAKDFEKFMVNAQREGASAAQIEQMRQLRFFEETRKKGGPLEMATAMGGAGAEGTFRILKALSQSMGTGFSGLNEHVIKQLGISEQQYRSMIKMNNSMTQMRSMAKQTGSTGLDTLDVALREMGVSDIRAATEDQILSAMTRTGKFTEDLEKTTEELATQQVDLTTSILDRLDNVITNLLDKIYGELDFISDMFSDLVMSFTTDPKKETKKELETAFEKVKTTLKSPEAITVLDSMNENIKKEIDAGTSREEMTEKYFKLGEKTPDQLDELISAYSVQSPMKDAFDMLKSSMTEEQKKAAKVSILEEAIKNMDPKTFGYALAGEVADEVRSKKPEELATMAEEASKASAAAFEARTRRAGTESPEQKKVRETQEKASAAAQQTAKAVAPAGAAAPAAPATIVTSTRMGTTTVENIRPGAPAAAGVQKKMGERSLENTSEQLGISEEQYDELKKQHEVMNEVAKNGGDTHDLIKKGVKIDSTFLTGKFKNTIKEATYEAFSDVMIEYAIAQVDEFNEIIEKVKSGTTLDELKKIGLKGLAENVMPAREMQAGGIVSRPTLAMVGEAGPEAVVPLGKSGFGGGVTIGSFNVNIYNATNHEAVRLAVVRGIRDAAKYKT